MANEENAVLVRRELRGFEVPTSANDVVRTRELIGHAPTPYETLVRETLARFQNAEPERHQAYASGASPVAGKI